MIYLLYGQPGTGKSTLATGIALQYLGEKRRVVANFPIDAAPACLTRRGKLRDAFVEVLPARPTFAQLLAIGKGWWSDEFVGREDRAGLLVIDECGPWLDSRRWNDKERPQVIDWLLHSRKRGWDILLIAQAPALVDKQVREAVVEAYARCRRMDRMKVPGTKISFPRMHVAIARYGLDANAPRLETWVYRGALEHKCFQSYALFHADSDEAPYCTLPPRLTKFRDGDVFDKAWRALRAVLPHAAPRRAPVRSLRPKLAVASSIMGLHPDQRIRAALALGVVARP